MIARTLIAMVCAFANATQIVSAADALPNASALQTNRDLIVRLGGEVTMVFVLIQPGAFVMGSGKSALTNEKPAHEAIILQPFYLGRYEVTQEQWATVMNEIPSIHKGPLFPDSPRCPVENVSWSYAKLFLSRLSQKAPGYLFRLPTEMEWEYACRAGTTNDFNFGEDAAMAGEYAWYSANSNGQTHPVGRKRPNAWGLYDMHGNVWEWCEDVFAPYQARPAELPQASSSTPRVLRGGAYNSISKHLRAAYRHDLLPDDSGRYYGLRCVAVIQHPASAH